MKHNKNAKIKNYKTYKTYILGRKFIAQSRLQRVKINKLLDGFYFSMNLSRRIFYLKLINILFPMVTLFIFSGFVVSIVITAFNAMTCGIVMEIASFFLKINSHRSDLYLEKKRRKKSISVIVSAISSAMFLVIGIKYKVEIFEFIVKPS